MQPMITLLLVGCVLAQTLAFILSCYRRSGKRGRIIEFALLTLVLIGSLLPTEAISGNLLLLVMTILLIRGIHVCINRARELRSDLSALSVKTAIDALHTGVLFCEKSGLILLCNERMQTLMRQLTGYVHRNGNTFSELLLTGDVLPGCKKRELERQVVYLLSDHSAWMFTWTELQLKRKIYVQLTAADITERWELTEQLQGQEEKLKQRRDEISAAIANLHKLSRERETQKAKMRAHDILGERLTLLLRAIRSEQAPEYDLLRALSGGLIDELKAAEDMTPQDKLDSLVNIFGTLGVSIETIGELPNDHEKARLFVEIAREAVTNAVKHGFATEVIIRTNGERMEISDNGFSCGEMKEGGGLSGMRRRLSPFGGALFVQIEPRFTLTVELP